MLYARTRAPLHFGRAGGGDCGCGLRVAGCAGFQVPVLVPGKPDGPGKYALQEGTTRHITLTAETHNFPTGIAPFPGATTGTGGRIRDNQSTGRGAHVIAGSAGYCVGNLQIPGYEQPWEDTSFEYPATMASPLRIEVEGSNGASDYGNKFGEPIVLGYTRAFGMRLSDGERREWVKPIMFTAGRSRNPPLATKNLLEDTDGLRRPP